MMKKDFFRTRVFRFSSLHSELVEVSHSDIHSLSLLIPSRVSCSTGSSFLDMGGQSFVAKVEVRVR